MKIFKRILGTVIFIGIGIMLFMSISYLLRPMQNDFYRKKVTGFYAEEKDTLDIVAFGSSALYRYLNTPYLWREFELTSYNVSTPSQSIHMVEDLIDEVLKTQSPQLIVVEARKFLMTDDKSDNSERFCFVHDNMKYSWNRIELINSVLDDWSERINAYFDIIVYHDGWENITIDNLLCMDNKNTHELKGWTNIDTVKKVAVPKIKKDIEPSPIPEVSEEVVISLMEKCKKENIELLFVSTPWEINEKNQARSKYLEGLVEEYGFKFLDCNLYLEECELDFSRDFYNKRHTNLVGSEKVTKFVGNYIMENYNLDTEHSEEVTADWNEMLELYNIQSEEAKAKIASRK